jgi:gluconate kinase
MGKRNYLIEGVSGAGKTTVATALEKLGYQAIHGDNELKYRGDPETGESMTPESNPPTARWLSEHQLWDLEKVKSIITNREVPITFFCGGSRNYSKFVHLLDGVFILDVDQETMMNRIDERIALDPTDFGGTEEERELILELHATKQDIPNDGIVIDATQPLESVVENILSYIRE